MEHSRMIYLTGASGLIGSRFSKIYNKPIKKISYRGEVEDVFESHEKLHQSLNSKCYLHTESEEVIITCSDADD